MANKGRSSIGYVIAGVADKEEDAQKLEEKNIEYKLILKDGYYITGLNYDIETLKIPADRYFQKLIQILEKDPIDDEYKSYFRNKRNAGKGNFLDTMRIVLQSYAEHEQVQECFRNKYDG